MIGSMEKIIIETGIFMICSQLLIHLKPNAEYEKYLKLLVSIMILIQIFTPVLNLIAGKEGITIEEQMTRFEQQLEQDSRLSEEAVKKADALLEQMTMEEVRERIRRQQESVTESALREEETAAEVEEIQIGNSSD